MKIVRSQFFEPIWFDHRNVPHKQLSRVQHFAINNPKELKRKPTIIKAFKHFLCAIIISINTMEIFPPCREQMWDELAGSRRSKLFYILHC